MLLTEQERGYQGLRTRVINVESDLDAYRTGSAFGKEDILEILALEAWGCVGPWAYKRSGMTSDIHEVYIVEQHCATTKPLDAPHPHN